MLHKGKRDEGVRSRITILKMDENPDSPPRRMGRQRPHAVNSVCCKPWKREWEEKGKYQ